MKQVRSFTALLFLWLPIFAVVPASAEDDTFEEDTVMEEAADFFGEGTEGIGDVIEKLFKDLGRPNAYIKGEEASGALGIGTRYGNGTLIMKSGGTSTVHWTGPSIGFDAGGNVAKVFVLVYDASPPWTAAFTSSAASAPITISTTVSISPRSASAPVYAAASTWVI